MYLSGQDRGTNRFRFHIRELDEKVRERVMIGEGLHSAIENEELELYYQPQVELKSGRIVGLETLIRWNFPERGLLLPEQFIPIAESNGSILQIGQWVIERVCRQIAVWQRQGIVPQVVAANISAGHSSWPAIWTSWSPQLWLNTALLQTSWNWN